MSIEAYTAVWQTGCPANIKIVLLAMADFASSKNGYTCSASLETIAAMAGKSARQVRSDVRALEERGLITTAVNKGRSHTNVYDLSGIVLPEVQRQKIGSTASENRKPTSDYEAIKPEAHFLLSDPKIGSTASENRKYSVIKPEVGFRLSVNNLIEPLLGDRKDVDELAQFFTQVAGILPKRSGYEVEWIDPLEMYIVNLGGVDQAKKAIKSAVEFMRNGNEKSYTITSPRSLATVIANMPKNESTKMRVSAR